MIHRISAVTLVIFAVGTVWGQSSSGPLTSRSQPVMATSNAEGIAAANRAKAAANQSLQNMGATLTKMQGLLKQMRARTASAKDPVAKANLEMWTLMLDQLDKQYEEMRLAARQREELEARRASMYRQANERAEEAARKAQEAAKTGASAPASAQTTTTPTAPSTSPN